MRFTDSFTTTLSRNLYKVRIPCSLNCNFFFLVFIEGKPNQSTFFCCPQIPKKKKRKGRISESTANYLIMSSRQTLLNHPEIFKDLDEEDKSTLLLPLPRHKRVALSVSTTQVFHGVSLCVVVVADKFNPISVFSALFPHLI